MQEATSSRILRAFMWGALLLSSGCKEPNRPPAPPSGEQRLADRYPCDQGIAGDPAVVWAENFEEGSVSAVTARYDDHKNAGGMALVTDKPSGSCGSASMQLTADGGNVATQATDLYKRLDTGQDQLYVRRYAKYQAGVPWHHTGVWFGGYNPPNDWPSPQTGIKHPGNDPVPLSTRPTWGSVGSHPA